MLNRSDMITESVSAMCTFTDVGDVEREARRDGQAESGFREQEGGLPKFFDAEIGKCSQHHRAAPVTTSRKIASPASARSPRTHAST
jgi:hypothetical protein